jgi:hypothetical protein
MKKFETNKPIDCQSFSEIFPSHEQYAQNFQESQFNSQSLHQLHCASSYNTGWYRQQSGGSVGEAMIKTPGGRSNLV